MIRKLLLATVAAGLMVGVIGCHHKCHHHKDQCCPPATATPGRSPILLPPAGVPTTPGAPVPSVQPGPSGYIPPPALMEPPAPKSGPEVLFPDPLPGGPSSRTSPGFLGPPTKATAEPPKAGAPNGTGLPGYMKVKDGLYAGRKPTLDGFDSLRSAGFRTVIYLHASGADVSAVKDMA